ncbi:lytic transglycosylase domain-containing protein [Pseudescherichia vulneris]|uniref:lytic transglycosylase domain-containing protein n=1 Tax=Pseudescherichia vulneris TaxID=566 RepID=UPI00227B0829|nr:lytic transglycosylase domain-containing protein [Pseudescherichia vulneris]WAH52620.1 lytic transglycosylase domain-containing protein [Pseudescherichia vulneris]
MPTIIDSLVVTLGLDPSGFKKGQKEVKDGLSDTRDNADQTAKDMEAAGKRAASFFGSIRTEVLALAGITLSLVGVKNFVTGMTESLTRLSVTSQALDLTPKQLEGWTGAAEAVGSSGEKITGVIGNLQKLVNDFRGGGNITDNPLRQVLGGISGVIQEQFDLSTMSGADILQKISNNWGKLTKDAQRKVGSDLGLDDALIQSFAETGKNSFESLRKDFEDQSNAVSSLGYGARELNIQFVSLRRSFEAAGQSLFKAMLPYLLKIPPLLVEFSNWISAHGPEIEGFFSEVSDSIGGVVDAVGGWQNALAILLAYFTGSWLVGMLGAINRVGGGLSGLGKLGVIGGTIYGASEFADWIDKNSGPKTKLSENGIYYEDSWVGQGLKFLGFGSDGSDKANPEDPAKPSANKDGEATLGLLFDKMKSSWGALVQGSKAQYKPDPSPSSPPPVPDKSKAPLPPENRTSEPYEEKIYPINEVIRGDDQKAQQESNRLLEGILSSIKKLSSILTDQDQPQENVQEQAGYLLRDRPQQLAEAPKPTKAGAALLGWMQPAFENLERLYNLPMGLLRSVATTESGGNQYAQSGAGAKGLFQFMDGTASDMGLKGNDVWDPMKSAEAAAKYLSQLLRQFGGDLNKALASYNWGPGNVQRKGLENAPAETQAYVPKVLAGVQLGAGANANVMKAAQPQQGNKTDIHIGEMTVQSNASSIKALGEDVNASTRRNGLVMAYSSGQ